jgi:hypothetical protein
MRIDIINHILETTNSFSSNPLSHFMVSDEESVGNNVLFDNLTSGEEVGMDDEPTKLEEGPDNERLLDVALCLHDVQIRTLKVAVKYNDAKKAIVKQINELYTKWNSFLETEKFEALTKGQKSLAWDKYKSHMNALKERNEKAKPFVQEAWNNYNQAKAEFNSYMEANTSLWPLFYSLMSDESDSSGYWTRSGESWQAETEIVTADDLIKASQMREINQMDEEEAILARIGISDQQEEEESEVNDLLATELGI